uniref:Peptidase S1 domain-containing protein n=1 Tax=Acanthochromis polyacanthus TaxID=80966 RepID=A0A3Q1EZ90_9TELE
MARLTFLLLLLWVGVTVSTVVDLQKRIYGGKKCDDDKRLYHATLSISVTGDDIHCGGSLIKPQWVLTAAHCKQAQMYAVAGVHPGSEREVSQVIHEKSYNLNHDIMLLKLNKPITDRKKVIPPPDNVELPDLHCADIPVVDCTNYRHHLQTNFPNFYQNKNYQHWFCGQSPTVDACHGDSGGGVVYNGQIYGVFSFSGDNQFACAQPAAFMNLCHPEYNAWITRILTTG